MFELDKSLRKAELIAAVEQASEQYPQLAEIDLDQTKAQITEDIEAALAQIAEDEATLDEEIKEPAEEVSVTDEEEAEPEPQSVEETPEEPDSVEADDVEADEEPDARPYRRFTSSADLANRR